MNKRFFKELIQGTQIKLGNGQFAYQLIEGINVVPKDCALNQYTATMKGQNEIL